MPFLLLLLMTVACLPFRWPRPPQWVGAFGSILRWQPGEADPAWDCYWGSVALTWLSVLLVMCVLIGLGRWLRWKLARQPAARENLARRLGTWRLATLLGLFLVYGLSLYAWGWGWVVQGGPLQDASREPWPGSELLVLAPFLLGLVLSWICFYDVERAIHDAGTAGGSVTPFWSRAAYVGFHVRHNLALVFVPLFLLILVNDLPRLLPHHEWISPALPAVLGVGAGLAVLVFMPLIVRAVLSLKAMPQGRLRDRLVAAGQRLRFRCSNILIWNTRGGIANAMVVGVMPLLRYVILTDRLIAEMTEEEVEAVFGHEAGHVKHHHMSYYLGFFMLSFAVMTGLWEISNLDVVLDLSARKDLAILPPVCLLGTYIFLVFGFLSRRCERQADVFGCRAVSCARPDCLGHDAEAQLSPLGRDLCSTGIHIFINALEKVAYLNGISRERPGWHQSWLHSTIARRVDFLQRILRDRTVERRFQRTVVMVKWLLFLALMVVSLVLTITWLWPNLLMIS